MLWGASGTVRMDGGLSSDARVQPVGFKDGLAALPAPLSFLRVPWWQQPLRAQELGSLFSLGLFQTHEWFLRQKAKKANGGGGEESGYREARIPGESGFRCPQLPTHSPGDLGQGPLCPMEAGPKLGLR